MLFRKLAKKRTEEHDVIVAHDARVSISTDAVRIGCGRTILLGASWKQ